MRPRPIIALALAATLALSGCMLFEASPESQVATALERFRDGLGPDGDVKKITGNADVEGVRAELEIEFGANDALRVSVDAMMFRVVMTCVDGRMFLSMMGDTVESRAGDEECSLDFGDEEFEVPLADETEDEVVDVTRLPDGAIQATIRTTDDDGEQLVTVIIRDGRLVEMTMEDDEGTMTLTVEYGVRRTIAAPNATGRMPASVVWDTQFQPGTYMGTVVDTDAALPLEEFSLQVREGWGSDAPLVSVPLLDGGPHSADGFTVAFQDNGDGLLSAGDTFTITNAEWEWEFEYQVAFFDHWAGMRTDENPMPGPAFAVVAFAVVALVGAVWRRRLREEA